MPRLSLASAVVAATVIAAAPAAADIDPPAGLEWLRHGSIRLENPGDFPEWVFVVYPCSRLRGAPLSLDPYCILRGEDPAEPAELDHISTLHALSVRESTVVFDPKGGVDGQGAWTITRPKIDDPAVFFAKDRRLARPGFTPEGPWFSTVPEGLGIRSATFYLRVESVGDGGVKARFSRVRYTCRTGDAIELPWEPGSESPPLPTCPVVSVESAPAELPQPPQPPERDRRQLWLGLVIAGVSLLAGGFLLKRDAKAAR
jgi:hypothetical protein